MPVTIAENQPFAGLFLLREAPQERAGKDGRPFVVLPLSSCERDYDAKMWGTSLASLPRVGKGDIVRAEGAADLYQGRISLTVRSLAKEEGEVDLREVFPSSARSEEEQRKEWHGRVKSFRDPHLLLLFKVIEGDTPFFTAFFRSPAAVGMHHARIGGLAEHSLSAARMAESIAALYPLLRAETAVAGALLHDIGKVKELGVEGGFSYTREGRLAGHIVLGAAMLERWIGQVPGFPAALAQELVHILLAHHGEKEHGSPVEPATAEALVVHFADDLDAKMDMVARAAREGGESGWIHGLRRNFYLARAQEEAVAEPAPAPASGRRGPGKGDQGALF